MRDPGRARGRRDRGARSAVGPAAALLALSLLALPSPAAGQPAMDAGRIRADTFAYDVRYGGEELGTLRVSWARTAEGGLRVSEEVSGTLGDEVTTYVVTDSLRPVSARRRGRLGPASSELDLSYAGGRVTGEAEAGADSTGNGRRPGDIRRVTVDRPLPGDVIDSNTVVAALLASPLTAGDTLGYRLFRPGSGVVGARARVVGAERVRVPAGSFRTYRVVLSTDQGEFVLWVTRETPRMLVRQAFRGRPLEVVLRAVGAEPTDRRARSSRQSR